MPSTPLSRVLVPSKIAALMIGRSLHTLKRARCDRDDLHMPAVHRVNSQRVGYLLPDLMDWAFERGQPLDWTALPLSVALPAADAMGAAGLGLPAALRAT